MGALLRSVARSASLGEQWLWCATEGLLMTSVALMRMPTPEVSLLRSVFQVVATRGLSFNIAETPDEIAKAEIVVLDADNATAMALWSALKEQQPGTIGILVAKKPPPTDGQLWVQRPLNSMKVLAALGKADLKRVPKRSEQTGASSDGTPMLKDLRVLVIDDSETVRKQLEIALGDQGIDVQTAETGELGLHMLSTCQFDLIFLDVVLPGADGYQICKTIKKTKSKQRIPVVMLTSKSSPFDRVKGSLAGCDTYLTKPVELRRLVEILQKHLARRAAAMDRSQDVALAITPPQVQALKV
jgi:two-component system, cell cycle response regulator